MASCFLPEVTRGLHTVLLLHFGLIFHFLVLKNKTGFGCYALLTSLPLKYRFFGFATTLTLKSVIQSLASLLSFENPLPAFQSLLSFRKHHL
jgi:hypothetical protein